MKEYEAELAKVDLPPTAHQVLMTRTDAGGGNHNITEDGTQVQSEQVAENPERMNATEVMPPPAPVPPPPPPQPQQLPPSTSTAQDPFTTPADKIFYGTLLTEPITLDRVKDVKDVTELDEKCKKLLEEAEASLKQAKQLETEYKRMISGQKKAIQPVVNDPRVTRNINFNSAATAPQLAPVPVRHAPYIDKEGREVMATPKGNVAVAKKILDTDQSPAAVDKVYDLCAKGMQQQERAATTQRLASYSQLCRTSVQRDNREKSALPRDHESHTVSSDR
jgi:hypothetical protein